MFADDTVDEAVMLGFNFDGYTKTFLNNRLPVANKNELVQFRQGFVTRKIQSFIEHLPLD